MNQYNGLHHYRARKRPRVHRVGYTHPVLRERAYNLFPRQLSSDEVSDGGNPKKSWTPAYAGVTTFGIIAVCMAFGACRFGGPEFKPMKPTSGLELEIAQAERYTHESKTLSNLAVLEKGVGDFIKAERKIPDSLEDLVPKYLAEIPSVELGFKEHFDNSQVEYYPSAVIRDGVVEGARLKDTGHWGYVHNSHQVIIFVDCTHIDSRGKPWYQERGVF